MNPAAFAVRRWQIVLVAFLLFTILGFNAFRSIPRSVDPPVQFPATVTTIILPGADAAEIEETVIRPVEVVLQGLDKVKSIKATSADGVGSLFVEFEYGSDAEQALDRTIREVTAIRDRLPQGIVRLDFRRPRPTEAAVLQLALVSKDASWLRLEKYAVDLRDGLNAVAGVRQTQVFGLAQPEVQIAIDPGKLAETGLPATAVAAAVRGGGLDLPTGAVESGPRRFNVDAGGAYRSLPDLAAAVLRRGDGSTVRVGDVASVGWGEGERQHITRYNGQRAVFLAVKQKDGISAPPLRERLIATVAALRASLPPDMKLEVAFDQTNDIQRRLSQLALDFAIALGLVLITLLPLGLRASAVTMISIPLSLLIGVLAMWLLGFTLNQISISGFILSLGLLVDDSIVVVENTERHLRMGKSPAEAAISATGEISAAVLGSTGVLIFAFLPIANLPESSGDFVRGLPVAVIVTVLASLVVSLTIVPFFASRMLKRGPADGNRFLRAINGGIHKFYTPFLHRALDNPRKTLLMALVGCLAIFATVPLIGFSLFPKADSPYFVVRVEAPEGSSVSATDKAVREVSAILAQTPGVIARMDNAGRGNPQIFYNNIPRENDTRFGEVFVVLEKFDPRRTNPALEELRTRLARYPDAKVTVVQFDNGPPIEAPLAYRVIGPELETLKRYSAQLATVLRQQPGTRDIDDPLAIDRIDLDLQLDVAKAGLLNVTPDAVRRTVRLALSGEQAGSFRDAEGDSYPVMVRLPLNTAQPVSALDRIYVPTQTGQSVLLTQLINPQLRSAPAVITRYNLARSVTVTSFVRPGFLASQINTEMLAKLDAIKLPSGYRFEVGGEAETSARNTSGLGGVILLALFGIFGVLVLEFGRFREVLVVAGVIPLGLIGGLLALLLTGYSLSFLAVIGFVALIGIEIKNSILLVDFTTQLRDQGMELREAIERAGEIRFLPVLLTSVTAIGGLLPLALSGAPLYAPLAWVIIGGLISSTVLSRIVIPVLYLVVARR